MTSRERHIFAIQARTTRLRAHPRDDGAFAREGRRDLATRGCRPQADRRPRGEGSRKKIPPDGVVKQLILARTATFAVFSFAPHAARTSAEETILFAAPSLFRGFCGGNSISE